MSTTNKLMVSSQSTSARCSHASSLKPLFNRLCRNNRDLPERIAVAVTLWAILRDFDRQRDNAEALLANTPFDPLKFDYQDAEFYEENVHDLGYIAYDQHLDAIR